MALTETRLRNAKPRDRRYHIVDDGGLLIDVLPSGGKTWRLRFRIAGKQDRVTLGTYPAYSLKEARRWRAACKALVARGISPAAVKRGDPMAPDLSAATKELVETFVKEWVQTKAFGDTVKEFAEIWFKEVVEKTTRDPRNIRRVLTKDVIPSIGYKQLADVNVSDVMAITDRIKARGADQMALVTRNILKRLFSFAIARQKVTINPAAQLEAKYVATARSRDVALEPKEVGQLLRGVYASNLKRQHKLAIHLLVITMVRKNELINAKWDELDGDENMWVIPGERMKMGKPHLVPLSDQALVMLEELKAVASGSEWVLPSRNNLRKPICSTTLNAAIRGLDLGVRDFVLHDFRRTASTIAHEAGFPSDVIEKCLAHELGGTRGIYNRAGYLDQRRQLLKWWAAFVDAQIEEGRKVVLGRFGTQTRVAG